MVNIYKRYIKREITKAVLPLGMDMVIQCTNFVINAPMRQWKKRLWVVTHSINYFPCKRIEVGMENLILFLDE